MKDLITLTLGAAFFTLTLVLLILTSTPIGGAHFLLLAAATATVGFRITHTTNKE